MADENQDNGRDDEVKNVNTDIDADDSPFNADGYVGVDPYFQSRPLDKEDGAVEKESDSDDEEKAPVASSNPAPAVKPTAVTPPK